VRSDETVKAEPGAVVGTEGGLHVACGGGSVVIVKELQAQSGRPMSAEVYLNGHRAVANGKFN
jgi:methionyl-tRNA formyltransferase